MCKIPDFVIKSCTLYIEKLNAQIKELKSLKSSNIIRAKRIVIDTIKPIPNGTKSSFNENEGNTMLETMLSNINSEYDPKIRELENNIKEVRDYIESNGNNKGE